MADISKWYVVHTYSGYENKVASNIETVVELSLIHISFGLIPMPSSSFTECCVGFVLSSIDARCV